MRKAMTDPVDSLTQAVAERAVDLVVDAVDVNTLLGRVDVNRLLDRVDVNRLLGRVDVNRLLNRVDMDALLDRADISRLLARVDIDSMMAGTDIGTVISRSSSSMLSGALDVVRGQSVRLDELIARGVGRLLRRRREPPAEPGQAGLRGRHAGAVSRFAAYAADVGIGGGLYLLGLAAIAFAATILTGRQVSWNSGSLAAEVIGALWLFGYFAYSWAAFGKTIGMALLGIRVVRPDGTALGAPRSVVRTLAFPLSLLIFGLGFAGILVQRDRRALHDFIAGSAVVYSWDARARAALFRLLARQ